MKERKKAEGRSNTSLILNFISLLIRLNLLISPRWNFFVKMTQICKHFNDIFMHFNDTFVESNF